MINLKSQFKKGLNTLYNFLREIHIKKQRKAAENILLSKIKTTFNNNPPHTVIVDATWDNPNHWLRYTMIRSALGFKSGKEIGLIGPFRRKQQKNTLRRFGIDNYFDLNHAMPNDLSEKNYQIAYRLCTDLKQPGDILKWSLPYDVPVKFLYDHILKKQCMAFVQIDDPGLIDQVHYFLNCISMAEKIIKQYNPDFVISSHSAGWYVSLVWIALKHNVKVIVLYGDFGVFRFWQITCPDQIYSFQDRPTKKYFLKLSDLQKVALKETGEKYLNGRFKGETGDIGGTYAYRKRSGSINRPALCDTFTWNPDKKIIGIYAANWFDYPHFLGMAHFRDYYDWIVSTLEVAKKNKHVNWLFKAHPCDDWYGGSTLEDVIDFNKYSHIRLASKDWQGSPMIDAIDGIVTYMGTIGVEATARGKPVLIADKGWYHDWGFVKFPMSREEYLRMLGTNWWEDMDIDKNSKLARIFAGWYWGRPLWQKDFLLEDDTRQWELYKTIPGLLANNKKAIEREIETIREWYHTDYPHYHTYKMMQSDRFVA